jgi:membrane protein
LSSVTAPIGLARAPQDARFIRRLVSLFKDAAGRWSDDRCYRLGASLSYYAFFSIFPLLLLCVTGVGFALGRDANMRSRLVDGALKFGAPEMRPLLDETLSSMQTHARARGIGAVVGAITLIFGASAVFSELQATFDLIWRVQAPATTSIGRMLLAAVRDKALSFLVVLGVAIALLLSLVVSAALSAVGSAASEIVRSPTLWLVADAMVSIALLTAFFAALYRMIPQTAVAWRDVWGGALVAAMLFTAIKRLFAWYLAHLGSYAAYGAVGGMLGLLAWIYLACLILFFGAEFAHVYAERYGSLAHATRNAS